MELPNTHTHAYEDTRTHLHTQKKSRKSYKKGERKKKRRRGSGGKKVKKRKRTKRKRGGKKKRKKRGNVEGGAREKKKDGGGLVQMVRGAWVLRRVGLQTNNTRSTCIFFSFSSAKGQTTQTTPLTM